MIIAIQVSRVDLQLDFQYHLYGANTGKCVLNVDIIPVACCISSQLRSCICTSEWQQGFAQWAKMASQAYFQDGCTVMCHFCYIERLDQ